MLAEPKRKQHWVLNPRGKRGKLYTEVEGNSTFGQRMMEKMGWSKGKGLGKKEDGTVEHVRVTYKNDNKGMGFKGNDGNWLENQSDFDSLLANLQCEYSNVDSNAQPNNLAVKSKMSKSRLHYHKMVQGKDLSNRSKEELQCILGISKKPLEDVLVGNGEENTTQMQIKEDDMIFSSKDSIQSYFMKLKEQKKQTQFSENINEGKVKRKKNKKKENLQKIQEETENCCVTTTVEPIQFNETLPDCGTLNDETKPHKNKKKKKRKKSELGSPNGLSQDSALESGASYNGLSFDEEPTNRKIDKRKFCEIEENEANLEVQHRKHKKRRKDKTIVEEAKENLPNDGNQSDWQQSTFTLTKKQSKVYRLGLQKLKKKKRKTGKLVLTNAWIVSPLQQDGLNHKEPKIESDIKEEKSTVKRVRFSEEVTVHQVAMHDEVRGGALRELLKKWDF